MNNKIIFFNAHWFWPVIILGVILLCIFIWKEYTLSGRKRMVLKVILSVLAISALGCMALKPAIPSSKNSGKIVLLTPGYDKEQLDSLHKEISQIKILDYHDPALDFQGIQNAGSVYVLGSGIPRYELYRFEKLPVVFIPGKSPQGIVKIKFAEENVVGTELNVQGLYNSPRTGNWLVLEAAGGAGLDSVRLDGGGRQNFELKADLKAAGRFVYSIAEKNEEGEVITRDPVPVRVEDRVGLRILIINNFPTFETRYLKNFLAEAGHGVVVRSQITSGRFKYEYFNTSPKAIGSFSRETLGEYDLLIVDATTMRSLGAPQVRGIGDAIRLDGLGVFVQPEDSFFSAPGELVNIRFKREGNNELNLDQWPDKSLSVYPFILDRSPVLENIHSSGNSAISGYIRNGLGRIGTTVLSNTFELVLEGNAEIYGEIWAQIIEKVSKREEVPTQLVREEQMVFPHEPLFFTLRTEIAHPVITKNERVIPLAQDVNLSGHWKGSLWPAEKGWAQLELDTTRVFQYYVFDEGSWSSFITHKTMESNRRFFDGQINSGNGITPLEAVNPLWFFGLFLLLHGQPLAGV